MAASRIYLRAPEPEDERAFLAAVRRSRGLHHPWLKAPGTPREFRTWQALAALPTHHPFLVCRRDDGERRTFTPTISRARLVLSPEADRGWIRVGLPVNRATGRSRCGARNADHWIGLRNGAEVIRVEIARTTGIKRNRTQVDSGRDIGAGRINRVNNHFIA